MAILKLHRIRVGDFIQESLGKSPSIKILSRKERLKAQDLHRKVMLWAAENLEDDEYQRFFGALLETKQYQEAYQVLLAVFQVNQRVTIWRMREWDRWIRNFNRGFIPS